MTKYKRGNVLIVVLIVMSFLLSVSLLLFEHTNKSYTTVIEISSESQGAVHAATALTAIRSYMMSYDDAEYDAPDEFWANIPPIPVNGGYATITLKPADDKLPVNMLANTDNDSKKRIEDAFSKVFSNHGYDDELWRTLKDWIRPEDSIPVSSSIAGETFNRGGTSYTAKYASLESLYEVRLMPDFAGIQADITELISVGDTAGKININFASEEVIAAFLPEFENYAQIIVEKRGENPFKSKDEVYNVLGSEMRDAYIQALPFFDVKSSYFYAKIEIDLFETVLYYHAYFSKNGNQLTLISYIEGGRLDYF